MEVTVPLRKMGPNMSMSEPERPTTPTRIPEPSPAGYDVWPLVFLPTSKVWGERCQYRNELREKVRVPGPR